MRHYNSGRKAEGSSVTQGSVVSTGSGYEIPRYELDRWGKKVPVGFPGSGHVGSCWLCEAPAPGLCYDHRGPVMKHNHRHHIIPRALGGSNTPANLVELCEECHHDVHRSMGRIRRPAVAA